MIRFVWILAFFAMSFYASAQKATIQHRIFVNVGLSMAPEDLAGVESADNKGYVENGPMISINYMGQLHRNIALGATLGHSRNNLNAEAISGASSSNVETEAYSLTFLMTDLYAMLPLNQWRFYGRGSLGTILPHNWEMQISNDFGNGTVKSGKEFVPAYAFALGINYSLGKVELGLESSLLASKPEFEIDSGKSVTYRKQWLSAFNHTFKTGFRF